MHFSTEPHRWLSKIRLRARSTKCSLFMIFIIFYAEFASFFKYPVSSQSLLNTPPILYVPERNWRISENEQVGQIIARVRAEDAENDELVFGLEPHSISNYANSNANDEEQHDKLPFRIDPVRGIVYLNESLLGRANENLFLYVTVSDGQLTAKNEVFVNILGKNYNQNSNYNNPPSITNVVRNISQFLPAFDKLPGVMSIRNQQPNRPTSGYGAHSPIFTSDHVQLSDGEVVNVPNQPFPLWPNNKHDNNDDNNIESNENQMTLTTTPADTTRVPHTTSRTKLTAIRVDGNNRNIHKTSQNYSTLNSSTDDIGFHEEGSTMSDNFSNDYPLKATVISVAVTICGVFISAAIIFGFIYRKSLCAISKKLKKKSKEEMAKKSTQSNLSSSITDDSRNSMVLQHWNGPMAYGNRYVPWESDQQSTPYGVETSALSTNVASSANLPGENGSANSARDDSVGTANRNSQNKYDRWEFPRHRLKFFNILGEGAFGQVWRCEATDIDGIQGVSTVAVKTLKENAAENEKKDLMSELEVMKSLEPHVNVVRLLGSCTDKDPAFVIIEFVNRGKLQTYLRNSRAERHYGNTHGKSNILTSGDLTSFMYQVAKGMDYLTSRGIIHRDLAARNILITDDHTCKVADFGFARDVITSKIYERKSEGKLPIRWMAIESLYDNIFSVKSDIWSFGVLMWEIVTLGSTPYPGISAADVMRKVRDGYRLEKPEHCRRELYNIMYYCWSQDANERPTFSEVVQMLDKLLHTEMDYIELERFPDHNYYNILNLSGEKV